MAKETMKVNVFKHWNNRKLVHGRIIAEDKAGKRFGLKITAGKGSCHFHFSGIPILLIRFTL